MKRALGIVALAVAGCSLLPKPEGPSWTTFLLESGGMVEGAGGAASETPAARSIRVAAIESAGGYDTPRMAYSRAAGEIEYFARHRWAETPAEMLSPLLVAGLERSGRFTAVLAPSSRANADLLLETELLAFRQEFTGSASFRATLRATIVNATDRSVVGPARTFEFVEPMEDASPTAGAKAADRAAARLVGAVAAFCAEAAGS
jgi:cholesterol transport system auxiliary component